MVFCPPSLASTTEIEKAAPRRRKHTVVGTSHDAVSDEPWEGSETALGRKAEFQRGVCGNIGLLSIFPNSFNARGLCARIHVAPLLSL